MAQIFFAVIACSPTRSLLLGDTCTQMLLVMEKTFQSSSFHATAGRRASKRVLKSMYDRSRAEDMGGGFGHSCEKTESVKEGIWWPAMTLYSRY